MSDDYHYSVQFNSTLIYLQDTLRVQRQITKWERVKKRNEIQTNSKKEVIYNLYNNNNNYINTPKLWLRSEETFINLQ
jgi:hypothetical protein